MANRTQNILCIKSMFNSDIVENLYAGVVKCISESKTIEEIDPIYVPGAFELPFMANKVINHSILFNSKYSIKPYPVIGSRHEDLKKC